MLGQSYITWPFLDEPLRAIEPFKRIVGRFNRIGERIAKGGLQFAYHNHGFEFVEQNGRIPYDIVLQGHRSEAGQAAARSLLALARLEADAAPLVRARARAAT